MPAGAEETLLLATEVSDDHQGPVRNTATVSAPDESGTPEDDVTNNESAATAVLAGDGLIDGGTDPAGTDGADAARCPAPASGRSP